MNPGPGVDTCVRAHDIETPILPCGRIDGGVERLVIHDVERLSADIQPRLAKSFGLRLDTLRVYVEHGDPGAIAREGLGQAEPISLAPPVTTAP